MDAPDVPLSHICVCVCVYAGTFAWFTTVLKMESAFACETLTTLPTSSQCIGSSAGSTPADRVPPAARRTHLHNTYICDLFKDAISRSDCRPVEPSGRTNEQWKELVMDEFLTSNAAVCLDR